MKNAISAVPPGRWAVGVSGGADSVALLLLLKDRPDLSLHVAHLDHQTREGESGLDAEFVLKLAEKVGVPCSIGLRCDVETTMQALPKNTSSRLRKARFAFFRQVVAAENLQGVILAHHADDQAETVLLRILRGAAPAGLIGMRPLCQVQDLNICRPLLAMPAIQLREYLADCGQDWREDASNQSDRYGRNRVRKWLKQMRARPNISETGLQEALVEIRDASESLRDWLGENAPVLANVFDVGILQRAATPLALHAAAHWLVKQGAPPGEVNAKTCERLVRMACDAASAPRQEYPGGLRVRRTKGTISAEAV